MIYWQHVGTNSLPVPSIVKKDKLYTVSMYRASRVKRAHMRFPFLTTTFLSISGLHLLIVQLLTKGSKVFYYQPSCVQMIVIAHCIIRILLRMNSPLVLAQVQCTRCYFSTTPMSWWTFERVQYTRCFDLFLPVKQYPLSVEMHAGDCRREKSSNCRLFGQVK